MAAPVMTQAEIDEIGSSRTGCARSSTTARAALAERVDNFKALNGRLDTLEAKSNRVELNADDDDLIDLEERRAARRKARDQKAAARGSSQHGREELRHAPALADERAALVPLEGKDGQLNQKLLQSQGAQSD
jgi:hypothetical protein